MQRATSSLDRLAYLILCTAAILLSGPAAVSQEEAVSSAERSTHAEAHEPGCFSREREVITDRPTVSSGTETTQCGVIELLSGPERLWQGHGAHQDDLAPSLQFGLTPRLDVHYARATFFRLGGNPGPLSGAGDTFAGIRVRFNRQARHTPSFGSFYTLKIPTGSPRMASVQAATTTRWPSLPAKTSRIAFISTSTSSPNSSAVPRRTASTATFSSSSSPICLLGVG